MKISHTKYHQHPCPGHVAPGGGAYPVALHKSPFLPVMFTRSLSPSTSLLENFQVHLSFMKLTESHTLLPAWNWGHFRLGFPLLLLLSGCLGGICKNGQMSLGNVIINNSTSSCVYSLLMHLYISISLEVIFIILLQMGRLRLGR